MYARIDGGVLHIVTETPQEAKALSFWATRTDRDDRLQLHCYGDGRMMKEKKGETDEPRA